MCTDRRSFPGRLWRWFGSLYHTTLHSGAISNSVTRKNGCSKVCLYYVSLTMDLICMFSVVMITLGQVIRRRGEGRGEIGKEEGGGEKESGEMGDGEMGRGWGEGEG